MTLDFLVILCIFSLFLVFLHVFDKWKDVFTLWSFAPYVPTAERNTVAAVAFWCGGQAPWPCPVRMQAGSGTVAGGASVRLGGR